MKINHLSKSVKTVTNVIIACSVIFLARANLRANSLNQDEGNYTLKFREVIASVRAGTVNSFDPVATDYHNERISFGNELLAIFKDTHSSQGTKGAAAYYLGEIRFSEASDELATNIALEITQLLEDHMALLEGHLEGHLAAQALIKIGTPAIPPLIRNLANSDDKVVRGWSMLVLCRIEDDKDVVHLRLQKALAAEKDPQKQARLQAASKMLNETSFGT
jgi:hypothetical protein